MLLWFLELNYENRSLSVLFSRIPSLLPIATISLSIPLIHS